MMRERWTGFPGRSTHNNLWLMTVALAATIFLAAAEWVPAATIDRNFIDDGETLPIFFLQAGAEPDNAVGGGNLVEIFNAAADMWETAIRDDYSVTINFGWKARGGSVTAEVVSYTDGGDPERVIGATVIFDNDGSTKWFEDPTPAESSEYSIYYETSGDFGAGVLNTGRVWSGGGGAAANIDLFTTALHEIGHALGFDPIVDGFADDNLDGDIDITAPRPFAGSQFPTISGAHLNLPNALMKPTASVGSRIFPSAVDVLVVGQASKFNNLDPNVPEPTSVILFAAVACMILPKRTSRGRNDTIVRR